MPYDYEKVSTLVLTRIYVWLINGYEYVSTVLTIFSLSNVNIMFSLPSFVKLLPSLKKFICGNIVYMLKLKPRSSIDLYGYLLDDTI